MKFGRPRKQLPHDVPSWIDPAQEIYFITIGCEPRGTNQLADARVADGLTETIRHRNDTAAWYVHVAVFMPDHVHFLVSFTLQSKMRSVVAKWKEWTAKKLGIRWSRDFFEHRLRRDESFRDKSDYILDNPVRAGLVASADDWPFRYVGDTQDGAARRPYLAAAPQC